MIFRKATVEDIPKIAEIYEKVLDLEEQGIYTTGWKRGVYPTRDTAVSAVESGEMFLCEIDGTVAASARINKEQVHPAYDGMPWEYTAPPEKVCVMHTLCVSPDFRGQGIGEAFEKFYEEYAAAHGHSVLRIDTNEKNTRARALYRRLGFREAGVVPTVFNGIPGVGLVCLEKRIEK